MKAPNCYNNFLSIEKNVYMNDFPACPECQSTFTYHDGNLMVCPECGHEWSESEPSEADSAPQYRDSNGTLLEDGDTVTVIKDLKIKWFLLYRLCHRLQAQVAFPDRVRALLRFEQRQNNQSPSR